MAKFSIRYLRSIAAILLLMAANASARADDPVVRIPESATVFPAGEQVTLNGVPVKMIAFSSADSILQLANWFAKSLGHPIKIDTVGKSLVLGKLVQNRYVTVQLEPKGKRVQGVVAINDLKVSRAQLAAYKEDLGRWLSAWPEGSRVMSDMTSHDQDKSSRYIVVRNIQTETINSKRVVAMLEREGYRLEREIVADGAASGDGLRPRDGRTLYLRGEGKEAMATITRDKQGNTVTVLNTVSTLGKFQ